jgi:hypothetical protein
MSGPFRENIRALVEKLDGGVAAVLMGFDGITVDSFAKSGYDGALPDIQTLAMEFAHLIAQARRTLMSLDAGALEEFSLRAEALTLVVCRPPDREPGQGEIPHADERASVARGSVTASTGESVKGLPAWH